MSPLNVIIILLELPTSIVPSGRVYLDGIWYASRTFQLINFVAIDMKKL